MPRMCTVSKKCQELIAESGGAFLVGLAAGRDPEWSAALSTAVASFTVEQYGIPLKGSVQELAPKRLHQVIGMQETLEFSD
mmetsp:Transcript_41268/g.106760  ORF Transcript_41268/g.106760 Transcript_41268/m.106760 type:complete len:81 (-) Transcript_41268:119-361(-)